MNTTPWFRLPTAGGPGSDTEQALLRAVNAALQHSFKAQQRRMVDDYCASWLYHRDFVVAQHGTARASLQNAPAGASAALGYQDDGDFTIQSPAIVKAAVDTVCAWLFAESPPLGVKVANASFETKTTVDMLGHALDSVLNTDHNADVERLLARDGTLKGFGAGWVQYEAGEIKVKRLHQYQLAYDPHDARDKNPQCLYVTEHRDKYALLDWLQAFDAVPHKAEKLAAIERAQLRSAGAVEEAAHWTLYDWELASVGIANHTPRVELVHCFRLASSPTAKDGRYTAFLRGAGSTQGTVLLDQVFERTSHPVVWWAASPNDEGIRGAGLYHDLKAWQSAIDRHMLKIQRTADHYGWSKIYVQKGSVQNLSAFAEAGVYVVEIEGMLSQDTPKVLPGVPLLEEDIQWVDKLLNMSFSLNGINEQLARGSSGLAKDASAVAMIEDSHRATDRLSFMLQQYKRFRLDLGRQVLYVLDDVLKADKDFRARFDFKGRQRTPRWADLHKQCGSQIVDVELRGEMAGSRAGRMAKIIDLASRQLIDETVAQEMMLSTPDVARAARLSLAGTRYVEWQLDNLIREVDLDVSQPTNDMDDQVLATAVDRATKYIYLAHTEGAKDATIERLRAYKLTAESLLRARTPAPPPAPNAAPAM